MARTSLTPLTALGAYGTYSANAADLTMTAADTSNQNQCAMSAKVLLIAHNTGASEHTVTVTSVSDPYGRTGHITTYALGAGEYAVFGPFVPSGWVQSDGKLYFEANHAEVKLGVVKLE
jgi:hypothetical protein